MDNSSDHGICLLVSWQTSVGFVGAVVMKFDVGLCAGLAEDLMFSIFNRTNTGSDAIQLHNVHYGCKEAPEVRKHGRAFRCVR